MDALEIAAVLLTVVAVYLTTREVAWCWPLGMVSVVLYAVVFWRAKLYADMGLQAFYFALSAYGFWAWRHGGRDHGALAVTRSPRGTRLVLLAAGAAAGALLGTGLHRFSDASLPYLDSTLTSFSLVAQWMQTRKLLEAWLVWLALDLIYVGMFVFKGLVLTAGLYAVFLALAVAGYLAWRRSMVERAA